MAEQHGGARPQATGGAETFFGQSANQLDRWLTVEPDGTITAYSGKVELGTGVRTALAQIVAEELDVSLEHVKMVMGDTALTPDEGYTAGSMTIQRSGSALRRAAAEARRTLLELASEQLDAAVDELIIRNGVISVTHPPDRTITYAELMGGKPFNREIVGDAPLKRPEDYGIVGTSAPRVDIPGKVTGQPSFIQDVRVPGMFHARLVRPPSVGAQLISIDETSVRDVAGLVKIVRQGNFIGVIAEREEQAVSAAKRFKVEWQETAALPQMTDLYPALCTQSIKDDVLVEEGGAYVDSALSQAAQQLHAVYYQPYHAHASLGPSCAVAHVTDDQITVWSSTQGPYPLRGALAQLLEVPAEKVHLIHVEGAGCYGQNGSDDAAAEAAILSRAVGRPVRVLWSREDEFIWEPKAAAMVIDVRGGLDAGGNVTAWEYQVWSPTHAARPRFAGQLLAAQWLSGQAPPPARFFLGAERNAPPPYAFPNQRVTVHWLASSPLRVSSFRSLGGAANTFANESFMDELAAAAGVDALEFRLRHLTDPRARAVLTAAAERAGWDRGLHPLPHASQSGQDGWAVGRGLAFAQYENSQAYVAAIAHVKADTVSGAVRVTRMVIAHDCGLIINPDGLKNQIEGNVIQSLSRALKEEVRFDQTRVTSIDWQSYPILTFSEVPDVEIVLINRPDQPALGAGEASTVTTAAAVANAIFDATGARVRQIPFTPERIKAALRPPERVDRG